MSITVTFRTDPEVDAALLELGGADANRSDVIREAILTAVALRRRARLREEAIALARDPENLAEIADVQRYLEPLRAW